MIIVTGTKRSGTSMWMQLLKAAGIQPIGDAFPRNWGDTIKDANPEGFYESELRKGIYYATNPHPKSGVYLFPEQTRELAVKVFVPGLIKTDRAFIDKVIATVRPWRQYVASLDRLYAMERKAQTELREKEGKPPPPSNPTMPPVLEWWAENFSLVSDIVTRRYPVYMLAYESVLTDTGAALRDVFRWLGDKWDADAAIAQVEPALRTQAQDQSEIETELEPEVIETFDALYDLVLHKRPLEQSFVDRLNETHQRLETRLEEARRELARQLMERRKAIHAAQLEQKAKEGASS
jgi:hypothetical protein